MKKLVHKSNLARGNNRNGISVASHCVANNFGENTNSKLRRLPKSTVTRHLHSVESTDICYHNVLKTFSLPVNAVIRTTYNISYPIVKNTKNKSEIIQKAFGLWKDNQQDGLEYQQKLRDEWE